MKRHLKTLLLPFFVKKHPHELIQSLDDLNPKVKEVLLTRGLINLLPDGLKG
jgi:hypothetical protein